MKKRFKKPAHFKGAPRNLLVLVGLLMLGLFALVKLNESINQIHEISFTTFQKKVDQNEVRAIHVSGQDVYGQLRTGEPFETRIPEGPQNWDQYKSHN